MIYQDFEFDGVKLSDFGAVVTAAPSYTIATRDLTLSPVPGRSGDVIVDNNRYNNVTVSYQVATVPMFSDKTEQEFVFALSNWLLSEHRYCVLRDTYNPGYFRRAVVTDISTAKVVRPRVVTATVTFNCEPFLYLDDGTTTMIYQGEAGKPLTATLYNPERWDSCPTIKINGNGTFVLSVTSQTILTAEVSGSVTIDKTNEDVYDGQGESCNDKISGLKLPFFPSGGVAVRLIPSANVTQPFSLEITPNWRRL